MGAMSLGIDTSILRRTWVYDSNHELDDYMRFIPNGDVSWTFIFGLNCSSNGRTGAGKAPYIGSNPIQFQFFGG